MVNSETKFKCLEGRNPSLSRLQPAATSSWQYTTCQVFGVTVLNNGDKVWMKDVRGPLSAASRHYVDLIPDDHSAGTFWGMVKL
jgi:hypothetical protein